MRNPTSTRLSLRQVQDSFLSQAPKTLAWKPKFMNETPRKKRTIKNRHEEHDLQSACVSYLHTCCPNVLVSASLNGELSGMARHVPKGIFFGWIAKLKKRGMCAGYADIVLHFYPCRTVFIEMKRPDGGSESGVQCGIRVRLAAMDFRTYICRSLDDLYEIIKIEKIPCFDKDHAR